MTDTIPFLQKNDHFKGNEKSLEEEITRLTKIIEALMNRVERSMDIHDSGFSMFENAALLENEVKRRTLLLNEALAENEQITKALKQTQHDMEEEISERKRIEEELKKANEQLEQLSTTDALTGLVNRRGFDTAMASAWECALRRGTTICLAMIDIDNFKKFNDRYGHQQGDQCLQDVARTLQKSLRSSDIVARYGGEEMAIILPETNLKTAYDIVERARQAIVNLNIPNEGNTPQKLTISIGITAVEPRGDIPSAKLLSRADEALYAAKNSGKNKTYMQHFSAS